MASGVLGGVFKTDRCVRQNVDKTANDAIQPVQPTYSRDRRGGDHRDDGSGRRVVESGLGARISTSPCSTGARRRFPDVEYRKELSRLDDSPQGTAVVRPEGK